MYDVVFTDAYRRAVARVTFQRVQGQGLVLPRLLITLRFEAIGEGLWIFAPKIEARLLYEREVLAVGSCSLDFPMSSRSGTYRDVILELPIERAALRYIDDHLAGSRIDLMIEFGGVYYSCASDPNGSYPKFPGDGWETQWIERGSSQLRFQVARSDWFGDVIQPIGPEEVIFTEILVPKASGDVALKKAWRISKQQRGRSSRAMTGDLSTLQGSIRRASRCQERNLL